jgi:hypothetical protein
MTMAKADPGREAAKSAEQAAAEKAARDARFVGKSAAQIVEMQREDMRAAAKARDDAALEADERRRGRTAVMGR